MLEENAFLYHEIGTQCGKCIETDVTAGRMKFINGGVKDSTGIARVVENRQVPTLKGTT